MRCYHLTPPSSLANGLSRTTHPSKGRGSIWRRSNSRCCQSSVSIGVFRRSISYVRQCRRGLTSAMATAKRSTGPSPKTTPEANSKDTIEMSKNFCERPLRGCLKSLSCREPTQHQARHREVNHGRTALGQPFIVFAQAARLVQPRQCAFDHPPTREQHKACGPFRTSRHTQDEAHMGAHPFHQWPPVAPIAPEQPQLFTGPAEPGEEETGASRVSDRGRRDAHGHQESQRINQQRALTPFAVLALVVAAFASEVRGLAALAVATARRRGLVTPRLLAYLGAPGLVETLPSPAVAPLTAIPGHTGPLRILMGEQAPLDAPIDDIKHGMDPLAQSEFAGAPPRLGGWEHILDKIPCGSSEVCGGWIGVHPQSVLH